MKNNATERKVIPFTGELYTQPTPIPQAEPKTDFAVIGAYIAMSLITGLCLGAISTYNRADQVELRQLKSQQQILDKVKQQICR